ncbi:NB-ARC domain-containing protein [Actinomadura litoris]|uniref:NB-ARC domain-containing protein n=1 Tax=Actinomadura litoris TaxID=2678616 RepID=A0A7K1KWN4_9ACTN|nr:NB-ARC domain-containing protein [Actinomadura litoris]MUN36473.1 hypothetical protein [Actinomadura litoris]
MGTASRTTADDLEASFDRATARALRRWARSLNRTVTVPRRPWRGAGHSGALLAAVILGSAEPDAARRPEKLIVKVCPRALSEEETRRHEHAWQSHPAFAERHLVRQPYAPHPIGDGRSLMFQRIAGRLEEIAPLSLLGAERRPVLLRRTTRVVLDEWNGAGPLLACADADAYLRAETRHSANDDTWLDEVGLSDRDSAWISLGTGGAVPNPVHLLGPDSIIAGVQIDYLQGHAHGDLHLANVLAPVSTGQRSRLSDLRFVDLSAYAPDAPLTRDPVTLMLSALLPVVGALPEDQAEELLRHVVSPRRAFPALLPAAYADAVWAIHEPGMAFAGSLGDEWRTQYLLSVTAHALVHSTYDNAGAAGRWWFVRLAAGAASAFAAANDLVPPRHAPGAEPPPVDDAGRRAGQDVTSRTGRDAATPLRDTLIMLPPYPGPVIERLELIEQVIAVLREPARNVVEVGAVLEGTGGFGKTVLAQQVCRREEVAQLFPDGVLWVDVGEHLAGADLAAKINDLAELVGGHRPTFAVPEVAGDHLGRVIGDRAMLLVVDDVWTAAQLRPFLYGAPRCVRLVTTRNRAVIPPEARAVAVGQMEPAEAADLLTTGLTGLAPGDLEDLLRMTGRWPLLLSLVNRAVRQTVRDGAAEADAAREVAARLRAGGPSALDLTSADDRRFAVRATMEVGLARLPGERLDRLLELSIFSEDTEIPLRVLEPYWHATGGLDAAETAHLCRTFADLSLVSLRQGAGPSPAEGRRPAPTGTSSTVRLHDVVRAYLRARTGQERLVARNKAFLDAMRPWTENSTGGATAWWTLPDDLDYLWRSLTYHLAEAGLGDELAALVTDIRYVTAKLRLLGPVPVEADLALGTGPVARELLWGLQRSSHLLAATDPPHAVGDILFSRLGRIAGLGAEPPPGRRIEAVWPPPDLPHPALRRIIHGHTAPLGACALSLDGERLVTAGDDAVRVWDMVTGWLLHVLDGHTGPVLSCAIAPDGTWAATTGDDGTVRLWDLTTGTERAVLAGHRGVVRRCAVSPDGTWLASAGDDHLVRLWDAATGGERLRLAGHTGAVRGCAIGGDGRTVVSAGGDGTVRVWDAEDGRALAVVGAHAGAVRSCAASRDGTWAASSGGDGVLRRSPIRPGGPELTMTGHRGSVRCCAISPDDTLIVSGGGDGTIRLWDAATGRALAVLSGHDAAVRGCAVSEDGAWLVTVGEDRTIRTWDVHRALDAPAPERPRRAVVRACAAFPAQDRLVAGSTDGGVRIWDVNDGRLLRALAGHDSTVRCCAVSRDGARVATGGDDRLIRLWASATGTSLGVLRGHDAAVRDCAFGPDGSWLVSVASDGVIRVWKVAFGHLLREFGHPGVAIWSCALSPDGDWLATVGDDSLLRLWDPSSGALRAELPGHRGTTLACAAGPDGTWVATGGNDHRVRFWDVAARQERAVLEGHEAWLNACCVSPGGGWAASAGYDPSIRVWDVEQEAGLRELTGHSGVVWALASGGTDDWLASAAGDETIRIWDVATGRTRTVIDVNAAAVRDCAVSPDGRWAVCVGGGGRAYLLDLGSGERVDLSPGAPIAYNACAVSPDGHGVAIAGEDGRVVLHDPSTGATRLVLRHPGAVLACAFAPDGAWLATSGGDGSTVLWSLPGGRERARLTGHHGWTRSCAVAPDGTWIATAGDDGTVRVWDARGATSRLTLRHDGVRSCAVAPGGDWIASAGEGATRLWDPSAGNLLRELPASGSVLACPVSDDGRLLAAVVADGSIDVWDADHRRVTAMRTERPLRGAAWIPRSHELCVIGDAGVYRYKITT